MKNGAKTLLYCSLLLILICVLHVNGAHANVHNYSLTTNFAIPSDIRFAVIGDFGNEEPGVADVADLVDSWNTDFIITAGDNRYGARNYDQTVGQFYCSYLRNAGSGAYCQGGSSRTNDFYPSLGNHDYSDFGGLNEYLSYFTLPGNERYYDFIRGPVHFFVLDSQASLESALEESKQMSWLESGLAGSTAPWQVVYFHHSPYSSGPHGSNTLMRWPFAAWGAEAVISGHDHIYERIDANGIVYFVNGLGGASAYSVESPIGGSQVHYSDEYGAMIVDADNDGMIFQFINTAGEVIDTHTIYEPSLPGILDVWVESSFDDVEQSLTDGTMYINSTDIELGNDPGTLGDQAEGLRFQNVLVPQGARITQAYMEFVVDEISSGPAKVEIRAQDINDAPAFSTEIFDVTDRELTAASAVWDIPAWEAVDDIHQSPDLSSIVQEVTGRTDWRSNNSMAFIITGEGTRTAESWDGETASAARLHIEFSTSEPPNVPPSASFVVSTSNLTASFKDTSVDKDGTIVKWSWSFGDRTVSSTQNPIHTYAEDGTYLVRLTVTDNDGGSSTARQLVTVVDSIPTNIPPAASFMVSTSNLTASFRDTSVDKDGTIVKWSWSFGDGTASSMQNPVHTYAADGTYMVSLTATDNDGAFDTATRRVTVADSIPTNIPPAASFKVRTSELTAKFKDRSLDKDGTIVKWSWSFGDGTVSSTQNPIHTYAEDGTYLVRLTVTDNDGAFSTASRRVTVSVPPRAPSGLKATASSSRRIDLFWTDNADNEKGFTIEKSRNGIRWKQIASIKRNSETFSSKGLHPGTTYYYRVLTYNAAGTSVPSNIARAQTDPAATIYISDMDGVSVYEKKKRKHKKGKWKATVTITVRNSYGEPVSGAKVSGKWGGGVKGNKSCVTKANGQCSVTKRNIKLKYKNVKFTIKNIAHMSYGYDPGSNSTERIKIKRPHKKSSFPSRRK